MVTRTVARPWNWCVWPLHGRWSKMNSTMRVQPTGRGLLLWVWKTSCLISSLDARGEQLMAVWFVILGCWAIRQGEVERIEKQNPVSLTRIEPHGTYSWPAHTRKGYSIPSNVCCHSFKRKFHHQKLAVPNVVVSFSMRQALRTRCSDGAYGLVDCWQRTSPVPVSEGSTFTTNCPEGSGSKSHQGAIIPDDVACVCVYIYIPGMGRPFICWCRVNEVTVEHSCTSKYSKIFPSFERQYLPLSSHYL